MTGIELHQELTGGLPPVQCDPGQVEQVLLALMINAIDAMPHGGNLWVNTGLSDDGSEIVLRVRDDGSGIPPEILTRIFEPFLTTKETGKGVGLGLAVSRNIVERHHGRIEVQSEMGKGTTFRVTLPIYSSPSHAVAPVSEVATLKSR